MAILLEEPCVWLSYGRASISCGDANPDADPAAPWADESNGLCGASVPGHLELQIGTHTGSVPFRIELHETAPDLDEVWDEVVEVSFEAGFDEMSLTGLMGESFTFRLPPGQYRVRYCLRGFEEAHDSEEPPDSSLLQFWPGPPGPGRIVKQSSASAAL